MHWSQVAWHFTQFAPSKEDPPGQEVHSLIDGPTHVLHEAWQSLQKVPGNIAKGSPNWSFEQKHDLDPKSKPVNLHEIIEPALFENIKWTFLNPNEPPLIRIFDSILRLRVFAVWGTCPFIVIAGKSGDNKVPHSNEEGRVIRVMAFQVSTNWLSK